MKSEEILSICKKEVIRLITKHNLNIDKDTIDDLVYMSFIECDKYSKRIELNDKFIRFMVHRTMFYQMSLLRTV